MLKRNYGQRTHSSCITHTRLAFKPDNVERFASQYFARFIPEEPLGPSVQHTALDELESDSDDDVKVEDEEEVRVTKKEVRVTEEEVRVTEKEERATTPADDGDEGDDVNLEIAKNLVNDVFEVIISDIEAEERG